MFGAEKGNGDRLDGRDLHIGIVQARFNESITNTLAAAAMGELQALGVHRDHITLAGTSVQLKQQRPPIGVNDLHIAAHARSEGLTLVSNNLREFERVPGLLLENWA